MSRNTLKDGDAWSENPCCMLTNFQDHDIIPECKLMLHGKTPRRWNNQCIQFSLVSCLIKSCGTFCRHQKILWCKKLVFEEALDRSDAIELLRRYRHINDILFLNILDGEQMECDKSSHLFPHIMKSKAGLSFTTALSVCLTMGRGRTENSRLKKPH